MPSLDRHEAAFVFDTLESQWHGGEALEIIIPALDRRSHHSFLGGDLIDLRHDQDFMLRLFRESVRFTRDVKFVHSSQFHLIYVNNVSPQMLQNLNEALTRYKPYVGFMPLTYSSRAKTYLSMILGNLFIKTKNKVLMGHEDDRPDDENVNLLGYHFEGYSCECLSLRSMLFDMFLSYKIERAVYSGFESDTELSLNAVSETIVPLAQLDVVIEDDKLGYLRKQKRGTLEKVGLFGTDKAAITELIRSKIASNYIYNLAYLEEHGVIKFNILIEALRESSRPIKLLVALEYKPTDHALRVITLYG